MNDIQEMVANFMRAYQTEVEKNGLMQANQFADTYLRDLSKDMTEEEAAAFTKATIQPLKDFLLAQGDDAVAETVEQVVTEDE